MHSIRVGVFRPFARIAAIATPLAVTAMLMLPNAAFAATTIGSLGGNLPGCTPTPIGGLDLVQLSSSGLSSYVVPTDGTITSWSTQAGPATAGTGPTGLQVWRLVAGTTYRLVGATSPLVPLVENSLNFFPESISVLKGDLIGLRVEGPFVCMQAPTVGDSLGYSVGPNPALNTVDTMNLYPTSALLNVIATVEPAIPTGGGDGCDQTGVWSGTFICDQSTAVGV